MRYPKIRRILPPIAVFFLFCRAAMGDVVILKDGGQLEGVVTEEEGRVVVRMGSIKTTIEKDRVLRIEKKVPPREEFAERLQKTPPQDAEAHYQLGLWCLDRRLPTEADACFKKVIAIDPNHEEARRRLGHIVRDGKWVQPCAKCGGTGQIDCVTCKGVGVARIACQECVKGYKVCETCRGRGYVVCQNCQGLGGFTCMACNGAGGSWTQGWSWINGMYTMQPIWRSCPQCNGRGKIDCPQCVDGLAVCRMCKKGKYKCPSCDGRGYRREACPTCKGAKKVECPLCGGKGYAGDQDTGAPAAPQGEPPPQPPQAPPAPAPTVQPPEAQTK